MKESQEREVVMDDVEPETFSLLLGLEFGGVPANFRQSSGTDDTEDAPDAPIWRERIKSDLCSPCRGLPEDRKVARNCCNRLQRFNVLKVDLPPRDHILWHLVKNWPNEQYFPQVDVLAYTRLYIFSERYLMDDVKSLSLTILKKVLQLFEGEMTNSFVQAIKYAFEARCTSDSDEFLQELIEVLMYHAVYFGKHLLVSNEFQNLMRENGEIGLEYAKMTHRRIKAS